MADRTREERLEDLVRDLHTQAREAGVSVALSHRDDWPLLREVTGKARTDG